MASSAAPTLKDRRTQAGLTQQEVARQARCSVGAVAMYESYATPPKSAVVRRIETVIDGTQRSPEDIVEMVAAPGTSGSEVVEALREAGWLA